MVLVKPSTVVDWHRKGFRLYWRRRSRHLGRPGMNREVGIVTLPSEERKEGSLCSASP